MQTWIIVCGGLGISFEVLTLASFLLVFVRMKSKTKIRKSRQYSEYLKSPETVYGIDTPRTALEVTDGVYWGDQDTDIKKSSAYSVSV